MTDSYLTIFFCLNIADGLHGGLHNLFN
jgi:hypothetical protein